jgi:uncharacterized phage protein (TIGR01671 family)
MNRQIKFKAWDIESKHMLSWEEILDEIESEGFSMFDHIFRQDHYILMQFTGLFDKNGKEIYEGDIVVSWFEYGDDFGISIGEMEKTRPYVIEYKHAPLDQAIGFSYFPCMGQENYSEYIEIIGNIHESPDLLCVAEGV